MIGKRDDAHAGGSPARMPLWEDAGRSTSSTSSRAARRRWDDEPYFDERDQPSTVGPAR
jgi:hypothetical protein